MSPDEAYVLRLVHALRAVDLEYVIVGMAAASLQGTPVMTQDVDILIRDTALNRERLDRLAQLIGSARPRIVSELSTTVTMIGGDIPVDVLFDRLPGSRSFEGVRARSVNVALGDVDAVVASLEDIIASKEAKWRHNHRGSAVCKDTKWPLPLPWKSRQYDDERHHECVIPRRHEPPE